MKSYIPLVSLVFATSAISFATDYEGDPCEGPSAMHAGECIKIKMKESQLELKNAYQVALERVKSENGYVKRSLESELVGEHNDWVKYRDSHCSFVGESSGAFGGWAGIHSSGCVLNMNKDRVMFLKGIFAG